MQKHNLAEQRAEAPEFAAANEVAPEIQVQAHLPQEEHKLKNQRIEWEHPQEKAQRLVPGLDLKRMFL